MLPGDCSMSTAKVEELPTPKSGAPTCATEMALVGNMFCIDKWEGTIVTRAADGTEAAWSPYQTPPSDKTIVVDSKVPIEAYLDAVNTDDVELKRVHLQRHAQQMRDHIGKLAVG